MIEYLEVQISCGNNSNLCSVGCCVVLEQEGGPVPITGPLPVECNTESAQYFRIKLADDSRAVLEVLYMDYPLYVPE